MLCVKPCLLKEKPHPHIIHDEVKAESVDHDRQQMDGSSFAVSTNKFDQIQLALKLEEGKKENHHSFGELVYSLVD